MIESRPQEDGLAQVPLSAMEHYAYCPRQSGLILLEDAFADDAATVRGTLLHQRVDTPGNRARHTVRTLHALPVWHDGHGLTGICNTVELHADGTVLPIEHKSGRYHPGGPADLQAAAQALCLEAMFATPVPEAVVYSAADRRRHTITVDDALRELVVTTADRIRRMLTTSRLPTAVNDGRCRRCSMAAGCMPRVLSRTRHYQQALEDLFTPEPADS